MPSMVDRKVIDGCIIERSSILQDADPPIAVKLREISFCLRFFAIVVDDNELEIGVIRIFEQATNALPQQLDPITRRHDQRNTGFRLRDRKANAMVAWSCTGSDRRRDRSLHEMVGNSATGFLDRVCLLLPAQRHGARYGAPVIEDVRDMMNSL